ncbi:MAG: translation initiation factor IF-2 subunit alpha [Candidatus Odinarchaeota archaeon]|nr:translation initiation factor IF-2 subunit alpha [Candidatus Odinarchaeota archaeon]
MVVTRKEWPEEGELVIATIVKIKPYGAYAVLDEYNNKEGMIHISEISTSWVKNIRDFIKEGQKVVTKVLRVIPRKEQIDLSIRRVTKQQKRLKIQAWKRAQKSEKILELLAKKLDKTLEDAYNEVGWPLEDKYGEIYTGFEIAYEQGIKAFLDAGISEEWAKPLYELIKSYIKTPKVEISGIVTLRSLKSDGVEHIKNALLAGKNVAKNIKNVDVKIYTTGAPNYKIELIAPNYKVAESMLKKVTESIFEYAKKNEMLFEFTREK